MTIAAAPSVTRQQSNFPNGSTIGRALMTSFIVKGPLSCIYALGFNKAQSRADTATCAKSSFFAPYSCKYRCAARA